MDNVEPSVLDNLCVIENPHDTKIKELADLDYIAYGQARKQAAEELEVPVTLLDKAVNELRGGNTNSGEGSIADELVNIVKGNSELFTTEDGAYFATFDAEDHKETWNLDSQGFREWVAYKYYRMTGKSPGDSSIATALNTLRGIAKFDGEVHKVWFRCAVYEDGYIIDLCNNEWQAVCVTQQGWKVMSHPPVRFFRTKATGALPVPDGKGDFNRLWKYANIKLEDQTFVTAWMLDAMRPDSPFPVLELGGFQGHAKSSSQKAIRRLIDPNQQELRVDPKSLEDMLVSARNNWLVSYNNLSHLPASRQDALCSISTGGGVGTRKFYTNADEEVYEIKRPVVMNGIKTLATAPDLVDRTVRVELPKLGRYIKEAELWAGFDKDHQAIFTGLLDLFVEVLKRLPDVKIEKAPRMSDFAYLGEALHIALSQEQSFMAVYSEKRRLAADKSLEGSSVAQAVQTFIEGRNRWTGTVKALYEQLSVSAPQQGAWPKSPRGLGDSLRTIAPAMAMMGCTIEFDSTRHNDGYHIILGYVSPGMEGRPHSQRSQHSRLCKESSPRGSCERREHREGDNLPLVDGDISTEEAETVPWVAEV